MMYLGKDAVGLATSLPTFTDKMQIESGIYIPDSDINVTDNPVYINHSLGAIPDFVFFKGMNLIATDTYDKKYILCGSIQLFSNQDWCAITAKTTTVGSTTPTSVSASNGASTIINAGFINDSNFKIFGHSTNSYVKKDVPYYYIIGKFKEVTSNA